MKDLYIIDDPINTDADVMIRECEVGLDVQSQFETDCSSFNSSNNASDVIKVILNLDQEISHNDPKWNKIVECENFDFNDFPMAMKSCINHFQLDAKQEAAFNIICSSFMLSYLDDPTITQFGNVDDQKKARQALLEKGGLDRLVMNLSGSGGSGKSFVEFYVSNMYRKIS